VALSQADGLSATIKSDDNTGLQVAEFAGGWREGMLVRVMVLDAERPMAVEFHER
jgi:hypothetical protein